MIELLRIRDFALVDELSLELDRGFTTLTGETGAGKSILLQALGLLLGDRASRDTVRDGAARARVEGLFQVAGGPRARIAPLLEEAGIPWEDDESLLIQRTVSTDGRSRAHVNAVLVPVGLLADVGAQLVEVSSQHQHQGLLREETHLELLDGFLGAPGHAALAAYREGFRAWREAEEEVHRLQSLESQARDRAEFLRFQVEEVRTAALEPGEDDRLRSERDLLLHAGKLLEGYALAEAETYSGPDAALDRISRAMRSVEGAVARDPEAEGIRALLAEAKASLEEGALRLRERQAVLEADPRRLEEVEDRLAVIQRLERKHGRGVDAILARLAALEGELWEIENTEVALDAARRALGEAAGALEERTRVLRAARREAAGELESRVSRELEALGLGRAPFRVEVEPADPGPRGADQVRFLLAPNPGEPARPLARIASGGELSRILLALKNALRDDAVETLVFDEVDAGIGGVTADAVAERLAQLGRSCQVICISHLPQIASRAEHQYRVEKELSGGRTATRVRRLAEAERVEELARMMAGRQVTEAAREHAREMMGRASR